MDRRVSYILGGPVQRDVEARKYSGTQPLSEFNVFAKRNDIRLLGTEQVTPGAPTSMRRRLALAQRVSRDSAYGDVLLASGEDVGFPLGLVTLTRRRRRPVWIIVHGSYFDSRKFTLVAPLLRKARHVHFLCLSEALRRQMVDVHRFRNEQCHNAGYGVDTSFFQPGCPVKTPLVVAAGSANRDYQTLIAAMSGLDVPLHIAVDSLWRPKTGALDDLAIPAHVIVASAGDYVALRALYERASFVVVPLHPARYASGYAVVAEAMAMGKAVITTRTDAPSDLVIEGETGFYTEASDSAGLRDKMRLLLDDPARARAMGEAGAARMQEKFGLGSYCQTIEAFIDASRDMRV